MTCGSLSSSDYYLVLIVDDSRGLSVFDWESGKMLIPKAISCLFDDFMGPFFPDSLDVGIFIKVASEKPPSITVHQGLCRNHIYLDKIFQAKSWPQQYEFFGSFIIEKKEPPLPFEFPRQDVTNP